MNPDPNHVEAYLLIEQPRQRLGHWSTSLAALDAPHAPRLARVDAWYDPTCDQAVVRLCYEPHVVGDLGLIYAVDVALLAEVGMVQPRELSEDDRARFVSMRLARCTIDVTGQAAVVPALGELVRRIRGERPPAARGASPTRPMLRLASSRSDASTLAATQSCAPRGGDPAVEPVVLAKGTRDNLEGALARSRAPTAELSASEAQSLVSQCTRADDDQDHTRATQPMSLVALLARVESRVAPVAPVFASPGRPGATFRARTSSMHAPASARAASARAASSAASPQIARAGSSTLVAAAVAGASQRAPATTARSTPPGEVRRGVPVRVRAASPRSLVAATLPASAQLADTIYAHYLRGGRWIPARIGALSLKGAALMSGVLPRQGDRVDVAFTFAGHRVLVRGPVGKVATARETEETGASTFSLAFELDEVSRKQLTALLLAARQARVTIKPPPARTNRRYPVELRVAIGTSRGAVRSTALDVSAGGMFVQPAVALEPGATVSFSLVLDDGGAPVAGRARVAREVTEESARVCGLASGFGLAIVEMSAEDRWRWLEFLARTALRADKRVLIGATPERVAELQAGLASVGYAVVAGTDPATLAQLATAEARPADAVLIDAGWITDEGSATLVDSVLSSRNVPCVTTDGERQTARREIDRLLAVLD